MTRRRVVITGIGAITPLGIGRDALWAGLRAERSVVGPLTRFDASDYRSRCAGQIDEFKAADFIEAKRIRRMDRFGHLAVSATTLAIADAALDLAREDRDRVGTTMGTALGGVALAEAQVPAFLQHGLRGVDPGLALSVFGGAASCNIAIDFGISGPNSTNAMSCASGTIAIGEAVRAIRYGDADVMFAGGSEAPLAPLCFGAFALIRSMSTRNDDPATASRPFDRDRDGFVMAEGATVLVLEERSRAVARGARIYAELAGYGTTNDAHHMTAPRPDGKQAARAMHLALTDAGVTTADVGYINAHGSSTPLNDVTETLAIETVFGERAPHIPISSTKGYYGHALGASGAFEAAISALAIHHGWLPPTVNLTTADPACSLDYIPRVGRALAVDTVLSNSFGFGGINACVVLRRDV